MRHADLRPFLVKCNVFREKRIVPLAGERPAKSKVILHAYPLIYVCITLLLQNERTRCKK